MTDVQRVIHAVVQDDAAARFLRHDPATLARALGLAQADVQALRSAERFFEKEKPILDRPQERRRGQAGGQYEAHAFVPAGATASTLSVTADTGTLLPGPDTGSFTLSATATSTTLSPPARPPSGVPRAPAVPTVPMIPRAPETPRAPLPPSTPAAPAAKQPACPPDQTAPTAAPDGGCACAAVSAIVANVSATAITAITAITAVAQRPTATAVRGDGRSSHREEQR